MIIEIGMLSAPEALPSLKPFVVVLSSSAVTWAKFDSESGGHTVYKILEQLGGRGYFIGQIWTDVSKIFTEIVGDFFCATNAFTIFVY